MTNENIEFRRKLASVHFSSVKRELDVSIKAVIKEMEDIYISMEEAEIKAIKRTLFIDRMQAETMEIELDFKEGKYDKNICEELHDLLAVFEVNEKKNYGFEK